jgi:NAD(P)-dependent dehydrogenase (short-subunit alcohol dehydrogenase family)
MADRVLITGCSTGIGRAAAQELHKRGFDVIATARRPETLDGLDVLQKIRLDVDDQASVDDAVAQAGRVDVLVNNAGWGMHSPVEKTPLDAFKAMFETNVVGAVRMMQAVLPQMRERGSGVIVNVTSLAGLVSSPLGGFYSATKHALEAIGEALHYEVGHFGIRVALVEPGGFRTAFGDNRKTFGLDEAPYDELDRIWEASQALLMGTDAEQPTGEVVAQTIADAVEGRERKLRWLVGADAELVMAVRRQMNDEDFEATMREQLKLDW